MSKLNHKLHLTTSSSSSSSSSTKYCKLSFYTLFISLCLLIIISYLSYYFTIMYSNPIHKFTTNNNYNNNDNNNHENIIHSHQIKLLFKTSPIILKQLCLYNYNDLSYIIWSHRAYLSNITTDGSYNVMEKLLINNIKNFDIDVSCYIDDTTSDAINSSKRSSGGNDGK